VSNKILHIQMDRTHIVCPFLCLVFKLFTFLSHIAHCALNISNMLHGWGLGEGGKELMYIFIFFRWTLIRLAKISRLCSCNAVWKFLEGNFQDVVQLIFLFSDGMYPVAPVFLYL